MSMKEHVTVVAALHIGMSVLVLLAAAIVFVSVVGGGLLSGDLEAIRITGIVGTAVGGFLALLSVELGEGPDAGVLGFRPSGFPHRNPDRGLQHLGSRAEGDRGPVRVLREQ